LKEKKVSNVYIKKILLSYIDLKKIKIFLKNLKTKTLIEKGQSNSPTFKYEAFRSLKN
jgi:hypothetical protein